MTTATASDSTASGDAPKNHHEIDLSSEWVASSDDDTEVGFVNGDSLLDKRGNGLRPRMMTPVSQVYDRNGKGYLDSTELMLRKMDSKNLGYIDLEKVFGIMETLQEEQKKSGLLIESLHKEQRRAVSLRKGLIAICGFAVLLALSNIGTSFAAARLAKDTVVYRNSNDLINLATGERIATTNKLVEIKINPIPHLDSIPAQRRRHLQEATEIACGTQTVPETADGVVCELAGEMEYADALHLYQQFCPNFPFAEGEEQTCIGGSIPGALISCGDHRTYIKGLEHLPDGHPEDIGQGVSFPFVYFASMLYWFASEVFADNYLFCLILLTGSFSSKWLYVHF